MGGQELDRKQLEAEKGLKRISGGKHESSFSVAAGRRVIEVIATVTATGGEVRPQIVQRIEMDLIAGRAQRLKISLNPPGALKLEPNG